MSQGLRRLLEGEPDTEVVVESGEAHTSLGLVKEYAPDVVIMKVVMHSTDSIEATRKILSVAPSTKVIGLSKNIDRRIITGMMRAGASGYLQKDCAFEELAQAIRTVMKNRIYLNPAMIHIMKKKYARRKDNGKASRFSSLTTRELEVFQLMAQGKTTRELASLLNVSMKTIETHRLHIMEKLNLQNMVDLVKCAIHEGIISLNE